MTNELQNIPPLLNAISHWLSCMLYIQMMPRKVEKQLPFVSLTVLYLILLSVFMQCTSSLEGLLFNLSMFATAILTLIPFLTLCRIRLWSNFYYCARAFILGGFASSLAWQLYTYFQQHVFWMQSLLAELIFVTFIYGIVYIIMHILERTHSIQVSEMPISLTSCIGTIVMSFAIYILSSLSFASIDTPFGGSTYAEAFNIRTIVYFGGVALLYAQHVQLCESHIALERNTLKNMLNMQYTNYCLSQESLDMINQKYHDLKHQIAILRSELGTEKKLEYLDRMEQEIAIYETQNKTGNQFLDTILTGKSILCQKQGIKLTCVADGAALDFMDVMDLSVLFGNALDNAIEAVCQLPQSDQRLIHLSINQQKGLLRIKLENRCKENIIITKGLPDTTKMDTRYHGFGLKSIVATTKKYEGSATVYAKDGWFELRILIPNGNRRVD